MLFYIVLQVPHQFFLSCSQNLHLSIFSNLILLGDFNVNFFSSSHPFYSHLCNIIDSFSLHQCVTDPTHTSPSGTASLIDLVFVSDSQLLSNCVIIPPLGTSDHNGIHVSLKEDQILLRTNHVRSGDTILLTLRQQATFWSRSIGQAFSMVI